MEQLHFITNLLNLKDLNITLIDCLDQGTHKELLAKLDYQPPQCPACAGKMAKYDFQKASGLLRQTWSRKIIRFRSFSIKKSLRN
ncbi:putative transposon protein [Streptococcus sanguinis]|nr:putative transposon protein [Streptococcus sanguinis]